MILTSLVLAGVIHEFGHWFAAKLFGKSIKFRFGIGYLWFIPIPRGIWDMPELSRNKQRIIAMAGFGLEFLAAIPFYFLSSAFTHFYLLAACIHLIAYRYYAGESSDFKYF